MELKSNILKTRDETSPHRSLLRATGLKDEDFSSKKPYIGVANSYTNIVPGHIHLNTLSAEVMRWIKDAGWVPFIWWVPAVCDWLAMYAEMRLSLPSRDHIADNIEIMMLSHSFDGWVWVTNCDKITPAMLMAAWRLNLPCIILTWWAMKAWWTEEEGQDLVTVFEAVWAYKNWKINKETLKKVECSSCPTEWSCAWLFTANSMACVTEALWMSLENCATTIAISPEKRKQAYQSWVRAVELVKKWIKPRDIMNKEAFNDAMLVDNAIWWSTNVTLHLPEIAKECWIDINLHDFDRISKTTPNICNLRPSWPYAIEHLDVAWWIRWVMKVYENQITLNRPTVTESVWDRLKDYKIKDDNIIRPLDNPYYKEWWVAALKWNICIESVVKQTSVNSNMLVHSGPAKVFYSEQAVVDWITNSEISEWDVVVLPYQWPAWWPGMPEMLTPTSIIKWAWFEKVALITDGRFSWWTAGPCIWHIYPEAYNWWRIWLIRDWDIIEIDIPNRVLNVKVSEEEFASREKESRFIPDRWVMTPMLEKFRNSYSNRT